MKVSGTLVVLVIVVAALLGGLGTWWRYTADNPTSIEATLQREASSWTARARFSPDHLQTLVSGTGVIVSSPEFPGLRMTGTIRDIRDDTVVVAISHGPPADTPLTRATGSVTVDSATAPR